MKYQYIYMFFAILLLGCNGDGSEEHSQIISSNPDFDISVKYVESELSTKLSFDFDIDSIYVVGENNKSCHYTNKQDKAFEIIQDRGSLCLYKVGFSSNLELPQTLVTSGTSSHSWSLLRTISKNAILGETIKIDFKTEMSEAEHPDDNYKLSDIAYLIDGDEISEIATDPIDDSLSIMADSLGIKRVLYSYENDAGDIIQGFIYLVVTNEENLGLESKDLFISTKTTEKNAVKVSDLLAADKDNVVFSDVIAYDRANITLSDDNKEFYFSSNFSGEYDLNYILDDGLGGITSGIIRFTVTGSEGGLENIFVDELFSVFNYVENVSESHENSHFSYDGTYIENGLTGILGQEYPTYDYKNAVATCLLQGLALPTIDDFEALWNQEKSLFDGVNKRNWPVGVPYITWDGITDKGLLIDLSSNEAFPAEITGDSLYGYLSCVGSPYDGISILEKTISEPTQIHIQATYDGVPVSASARIIGWSVDDPEVASISESGFITPLSYDATVNVTAIDTNGYITTKEIKIKNNALYIDQNGIKTGQDPYFNNSAINSGLVPNEEVNEYSCTVGIPAFHEATGFNTNHIPLTSVGETGRLCTYSYYAPFSGSGMFMGLAYLVDDHKGEGLYLDGTYNISELEAGDEVIFSGSVNVNDMLRFATEDSVLDLTIDNSAGSGNDILHLMFTYDKDSERWMPSTYVESNYTLKSTLLDSALSVDEKTGWLYFNLSIKISPDALSGGDFAKVIYMPYFRNIPSDTTFRFALDELSIVLIRKI